MNSTFTKEENAKPLPVQSFYLSDLYFAIEHAPISDKKKDAFRKIAQCIKPHYTMGPIDIPKQKQDSDIEISGIIYKHGEDDYGLWEGFSFSPEEEAALSAILAEHETEGCSIRGTKQEIADDFVGNYDYDK